MMFLASLLLVSLFIWPMWRITLVAPQYPGGVTMYIYINRIGGESEGTLQNINILNHYVGMEPIVPESIPELQYFQWIVLAMVVLGLVAAIVNRRGAFLAWAITMIVLAAAGLYDFYLWEYAYGHNLSPDAPIKIPGASYQPPLIGTKTILNFIATSLPHTSGILAGVAIVLALAAWWLKGKIESDEKAPARRARRADALVHTLA